MTTLTTAIYTKPSVARVKAACKKVLGQRTRKLPELAEECVISVLVPVYDEDISRLERQLAAFAKQKFDRSAFELVYVVNNGPAATTPATVLTRNKKLLQWLQTATFPFTVRVIDRSSAGQEIKDCNVGQARNFGLHAMAWRYLEQSRDGLVIHTDADTFPFKTNYLHQVWQGFSTSRSVAASGGLRMVLDLDDANPQRRTFFQKHITVLREYGQWFNLRYALHGKDMRLAVGPTTFSGAHMLARAIASVAAGGIPQVRAGEDIGFSASLQKFATQHQLEFLSKRDQWLLQTSIRESHRTGSGFRPLFDLIERHQGKPLVRHPLAPFFPDFTAANQHKSSLPSVIKEHYDALYPLVPLTKVGLAELRRRVYQHPERKAYAQNAIKYFTNYQLK